MVVYCHLKSPMHFKLSSINYGCQGSYVQSLIIYSIFTHGLWLLPCTINIDSSWTLGTDGWNLSWIGAALNFIRSVARQFLAPGATWSDASAHLLAILPLIIYSSSLKACRLELMLPRRNLFLPFLASWPAALCIVLPSNQIAQVATQAGSAPF